MKMFFSNLAFHTLVNNRRQYVSLFAVCVAGIAIMLSAVWITDGMLKAVEDKARIYYGGDLVFMGGINEENMQASSEKMKAIKSIVPKDVKLSYRIEFDARNTQLFFEGTSVRQRMFKGVDFEDERELLGKLNFVEGGIETVPEHNSMIISEPIARQLGIKAGDMAILQVKSDKGYINTLNMYISGIFVDSSLFGMYTAYLDIVALRNASARSDDFVNRICMYYTSGAPGGREIARLQKELEKRFFMHPLTNDKNEFCHTAEKQSEQMYALITLDANIKDLQMLIDAMKAVVMMVIVVLITIIAVGMGSTYRITVMKRITEIGTYRAIGMKPSGVKKVFFVEAFYLLVAGFIVGALVTFGITYVVSLFDFSFIPAFDIFLTEGHLYSSIKIAKSLTMFLIIAVTTILSMLFTIRNVVHISPVSALATTT